MRGRVILRSGPGSKHHTTQGEGAAGNNHVQARFVLPQEGIGSCVSRGVCAGWIKVLRTWAWRNTPSHIFRCWLGLGRIGGLESERIDFSLFGKSASQTNSRSIVGVGVDIQMQHGKTIKDRNATALWR
jgi:hypothetical protein